MYLRGVLWKGKRRLIRLFTSGVNATLWKILATHRISLERTLTPVQEANTVALRKKPLLISVCERLAVAR